jgi:hypothetical protein
MENNNNNNNNEQGDKKPKEKKPKQLTTDGGVIKEAIKKKGLPATNDMDKVAFGAEVIGTINILRAITEKKITRSQNKIIILKLS